MGIAIELRPTKPNNVDVSPMVIRPTRPNRTGYRTGRREKFLGKMRLRTGRTGLASKGGVSIAIELRAIALESARFFSLSSFGGEEAVFSCGS